MSDTSTSDRLTTAAGVRSHQLGDVRVSYLPDGVVRLDARAWLPEATDELWAQYSDHLDDEDSLVASVGALLVEHGERTLLVDAGFGPRSIPSGPGDPHRGVQGGTLLESLAAVGRSPADIDTVALTHLHPDHIGWLWPASPFTDARIVVPLAEWSRPELAEASGSGPDVLGSFAGQVHTVTDGEEVFPGVRVLMTPGHTVGHASYLISSAGQRLIAFGDALHTPIQVSHPELSASVDHDRAQAASFRRRLVDQLAAPDTLGFGVHFADVQFGRAVGPAGTRTWQPAE